MLKVGVVTTVAAPVLCESCGVDAMTKRIMIIVGFVMFGITSGTLLGQGADFDDLPDDIRQRIIDRFDADGDGKLDEAERRAMNEAMERRRRGQGNQDRGPGRGDRRRRGPRSEKRKIVGQFDEDKNGRLGREERQTARAWLKENPGGGRRGRGRRGRGGPGRRGEGRGDEEVRPEPLKLSPDKVPHYPNHELYDLSIVRTIFLDFEHEDWLDEVNAFYRTDVDIPATMTVDGKVYPGVGIRGRGNTSFSSIRGKKKSLNVAVDFIDDGQRLGGYRTLNLLNAHTDPSFQREVMYTMVFRDYSPAMKSNFVRLVINGENWGLYVNSQQFNKDFLEDWFGTKKGTRWKIPPDFSGAGGMMWLGDDVAAYKRSYQLKTESDEGAFERLMNACRILEETPTRELEAKLPEVLDVDQTLWFLAVDNVLMDQDGYYSRASDYALYEAKDGRFHPIPHDNNETFRNGGRGPGGPRARRGGRGDRGDRGRRRGRRGSPGDGPPDGPPSGGPPFPGGPGDGPQTDRRPRGGSNADLDPLADVESDERPLVRRMLAVPAWRARYLHHVRTVTTTWLDWAKIGPTLEANYSLIAPHVAQDDKRLYGLGAFENSVDGESSGGGRRSTPSFKSFVDARRKFLLAHPALKGAWPKVAGVAHREIDGTKKKRRQLEVTATVASQHDIGVVVLHVCRGRKGRFEPITMERGDDGRYVATTSDFKLGKRLRYYVEVRTAAKSPRAAFHPAKAEAGPVAYRFAK